MFVARTFGPARSAHGESVAAHAIALDPHTVANVQAVDTRLRYCLIALVVELNADEIDVLPRVRLADFAGRPGLDRIDDGVIVFIRMAGAAPVIVAAVARVLTRACAR